LPDFSTANYSSMRLRVQIWALLTLLASFGGVRAGVVINEFMAASSERRLVWDAAGIARVGSGVRWVDLAFDASSWSNGLLPAGYGFSGLATDLTLQMVDRTPSLYVRKAFGVTAGQAASTASLVLSIQYNDGFVAYLNGREVARANCGPTNHFVFAGEPAGNVSTTGDLVEFTLGPAASWLMVGQNVLAIQTHNAEQPSTISDPAQITRHLPTPELRINAGLRLANVVPVEFVPVGAAAGAWAYFVGCAEPSGGVVDLGLILKTFTPPIGEEDDYDPPSKFSDWVELQNWGDTAVNLGEWSLTDDPAVPGKWRFPADTMLPGGGFLVVMCDDRDEANAPAGPATRWHTNFRLNQHGGGLALFNDAAQLVDSLLLNYPSQVSFCSYGRVPDDPQRFGFLGYATPGATNTGPAYVGRLGPVEFLDSSGLELNGGIYSAPALTLTLRNATPGAVIRYTLDGTEPAEWNGTIYSQPLVLVQSDEKTANVVRARAFSPGWLSSKVKTATYLLRQAPALTNLAVLLLSGKPSQDWYAPDGLLAIVGGQWVPGGEGSIWQASGPQSYNFALGAGAPAEREVHWEYYFPPDLYGAGQQPIRANVGLRVAASDDSRPRLRLTGAASSSPWPPMDETEKTSFNVYFGGEFGPGVLDYSLFTNYTVKEFKHLRLRAGKNDIANPFITDELVRRLWLDLGQVGARGLFCSLYVNGVYKGVYNLSERFREPFFQAHYRSQANWDVNYSWDWVNGDELALNQLLDALDLDLADLANWRSITNRLDIDNAADYYLLNIYCAMWDWPDSNFVIARERSAGPDRRFRFAVWDAEGAFNVIGYAHGASYNTIVNDLVVDSTHPNYWAPLVHIFRRLASCQEFQLRFADRVNRHMFNGGVLDDRDPDGVGPLRSHFGNRLNELVQEVASAVEYNSGSAMTLSAFNHWVSPTSGRRSYLLDTTAGRRMLRVAGFWPVTEPPRFSQHGGTVSNGFSLSMTSTVATAGQTAAIYFSADKRDPRLEGGNLDPLASLYTNRVPITQVVTLKARARNNATGEWSPLTEATFAPAAVPASSENLAVVELMYHPPDATAAEQAAGFQNADDFEFLRLQNIGAAPIDLQGVRFVDGIGFDYSQGSMRYLNPGANVLVVANQKAFQLRYSPDCGTSIAGEYTGNLSNAGERLRLVGSNNDVLRDFTWGDVWPWPIAADGDGPSLLLVGPEANPDPANPASWTVSACPGGLPCGEAPAQTYAAWRALYWSGAGGTNNFVSGPNADPDGDGLVNFVEYALGLDPRHTSPTPQVVSAVETYADELHLTLQIRLMPGASDARFIWEISEDLQTWFPAGETVQILAKEARLDGSANWKYIYSPPLGRPGRCFLRLRAGVV